ncbi:MAG: hypothetical protein ACM3KE_03435, partial [Hyphomicrobiales bacterium]
MPGGGFEDVEALVPYQVRRAGSWVRVDARLSARGGVVTPRAITVGLRLSDGGPGPLLTLSRGSQSLSLTWPFGPLPVPVLAGPTATYRGVLPGVNLLVTALPSGVSELVEVTSAKAAADPELARIKFPVSGQGLSVSADGRGDLTAADGAGKAVFTASALMCIRGGVSRRMRAGGPAACCPVMAGLPCPELLRVAPDGAGLACYRLR